MRQSVVFCRCSGRGESPDHKKQVPNSNLLSFMEHSFDDVSQDCGLGDVS